MSISKDFVNIYKSYLREVNHYKKTIKHVENMKRKIEKKQVMATEEEIKLLEKEELNEEDEFSCTKDKIYYFSFFSIFLNVYLLDNTFHNIHIENFHLLS